MKITYAARYRDKFGEERTTILNDGESLTMIVRGVRFKGDDFDGFEPQEVTDPVQLLSFALVSGSLCSCVIDAEIPIPVVTTTGIVNSLLTAELELGDPLPAGRISHERLKLYLHIDEQRYFSEGKTGWFEDEMLNLQSKLPPGTYMKACINCAFSDYSPAGHGLFGGLACFRGNKAGYICVHSKSDLFTIWNTLTEFVQETHLCLEFERRTPGTGYRG